jgi:ABC-2 type transport system ATP-binding protein
MSGLDPIGRKMVKDLLVELRDQGTTIFFNTHILADVESICDRISIINYGHLIVE